MSNQALLILASTAKAPTAPTIAVVVNFPPLTVGQPYNGSINATNTNGATGAITFAVDVLPAGLTLGAPISVGGNSYTVQITGTPTSAQQINSTFSIGNASAGTATTYLFIVSASSNITIDMNLPDAEVGASYAGYVHGANAGGASGAMTYAADVLPAGLTINSSTGAVTGTTTTEAYTNTVFTVSNGTQTVNPTHTFKIGHPAALVANVTGTLDDGTNVNVSVVQGSRVPMVPTQPLRGSVIFHEDGLSICLENAYAGLTNDLTGTFTVAVGSTQLFAGDLTIWAYSRTRPFWVSPPPLLPSPELWRFPTYGPGAESASSYALYSALPTTHDVNSVDNSPMGIGIHRRTFGAAGGSSQFGPVPGWDSKWFCNPSAENLVVVRGMADSVGVWPHVVIDPTTNKMIRVTDYPKLTMDYGQRGVVGNPIGKYTSKVWTATGAIGINFDQVQNHCTNFCALSATIYGTDFDKEALALWANYVGAIVQSWPYRIKDSKGNAGLSLGSASRGLGRTMRSVTYAAVLSNDTAYFSAWMAQYAISLGARYAAQTGVHIDQSNAYSEGYAHHGYAPWQEHVLTQAVGNAIRNGFTAMQPVADYLFTGAIECALDSPHEFASVYELIWRGGDGSNSYPPATNFAGVLQFSATWNTSVANALTYPENSIGLITALQSTRTGETFVAGDFASNPSASDSLGSMFCMAVAEAANFATNQTRAQAAWAVCAAHRRPSANAPTPNPFANGSSYYIVPTP